LDIGCKVDTAYNYCGVDDSGDVNCTFSHDSYPESICIDKVDGCIHENALNYDKLANTDDGSCILGDFGACFD
jgi:hypothetical protein